ncbi:MAG: GxxExxY protein [bacterium]
MDNFNKKIKRDDLLYPDLSYKIVGALFEVFKQIGSGFKEKHYQNMVAIELEKNDLHFKKELFVPLMYKDKKIGSYFFDFLIEDKIVLELKRKNDFSRKDIEQIYSYMIKNNLKLGILANFTSSGVRFKRIVNLK